MAIGISPVTPKAPKIPTPNSRLTPEQSAWLDKLNGIVGSPESTEKEDDNSVKSGDKKKKGPQNVNFPEGEKGGDKKDLVGIPGIPGPEDLIIPIVKKALGPVSSTCKVLNSTPHTLILDTAFLKGQPTSGEFKTPPPLQIPPGPALEFVCVSSKIPILEIIVDVSLRGSEGRVRYLIGDTKTTWTMHFDNPRVNTPGGDGNSADTKLEGPAKDQFVSQELPGQGSDATFQFALTPKGGPTPVPPGPLPPGPNQQEVPSSCQITVKNDTQHDLTLADQGHDRGDFMNLPETSIPAGKSIHFVSVETPNSDKEGCKGFISWEVGSPSVAIWRIEWDNPEKEKNTAKATAEPQSAGFRSVAQIGQGEDNVPVNFVLGGGGDAPVPVPPVPVEPEEPFTKPPGSKQPTLRVNDKSEDGWVEFLQQQLNSHLGLDTVKVDGNFGQKTLKAVKDFQAKFGLQVDGTVGNQTWAALREATPEKPSTDGRKPHTFVEKGAEARWTTEKDSPIYSTADDTLLIFANSVGDSPIDDFNAIINVTAPGTKPKAIKVKIGKPDQVLPAGGNPHTIKIPNFKKTFPTMGKNGKPIPNPDFAAYFVEGKFDDALGPDFFQGKMFVV